MLGSIVLVTIGKRQRVSNRRMRLSGWTSFFPSSASEQKKCCMTGTKKIATMFYRWNCLVCFVGVRVCCSFYCFVVLFVFCFGLIQISFCTWGAYFRIGTIVTCLEQETLRRRFLERWWQKTFRSDDIHRHVFMLQFRRYLKGDLPGLN